MSCERKEKLPFQMEVGVAVQTVTPESMETKTKLFVNDGVISAEFFAGGSLIGGGTLIPDVVDVRVIDKDGSPKVVVVSFADGTKEKAVLDASDTYSLEQGISICITKKLLGRNTPYGGALYNKVIKRALDVMKNNELARECEKNAIITAQQNAETQAINNQTEIDKAEAEAKVKLTNAQAEADAAKIKAEAKAEANKKLAASITKELIENNKIDKWNGELPEYMGDGLSLILNNGSTTEEKTEK